MRPNAIFGLGLIALAAALPMVALSQRPDAPAAANTRQQSFKLGTFDIQGRETVGVVLNDAIVVDLEPANRDFEARNGGATVRPPTDMKDLIKRYDDGVSERIKAILTQLNTNRLLDRTNRPGYVHNVADVRTLAPIRYPGKSLNAGANYYGHAGETGTPEEQRAEADARRKDRLAPYLFQKPMGEGVVIGNGDDIVMPRGRTQVDWECELAVVIGKPAKYVTMDKAADYIFGYTIELDMSDRGGRPEKSPKFPGPDWLIGKGHDTFAPMGPWIVPKEFYPTPMNIGQKLTVNGKVMQDSRSTDMIHNIYELIEWGSSILTLYPGDVISAGSPSGTGMSRSVRPEQIWLKPGDKIVATIDGIGTMTHSVKEDSSGPPPRKVWTDAKE